MDSIVTRKDLWDSAGKAGMVLGAVSCLYTAITQLLASVNSSPVMAAILAVLDIILWAGKFAGCILLMKYFMMKFAAAHPGLSNNDTFKFGVAVAFLSALLFSGFYLAYVTIIAPDTFTNALETVKESYGSIMGQEAIDAMESMNMASMSFFSNLIYCFLFGTVLSLILSKNIPSRNPFNEQ